MKNIIDIEDINEKFYKTIQTKDWEDLQTKFNDAVDIYVIGHGGNLAIADHTAVDITRLSSGKKNAMCPGSGVVATSLINDSNFDQWLVNWLIHRTTSRTKKDMSNSLVYGISSSGTSRDVIKALQWASDNGMKTALLTGQPIDTKIKINNLTIVNLDTKYYHTSEVLTLLLQYQLTQGSGRECPPIGKNSPEDLERINWKGADIRKHSFPDETINIGIDFDGVIHKCSKGFYDGTIYDEPIEGSFEALSKLSKKYKIIIHTCKAKPDRGLTNGKNGIQLVWEWLEKHNMSQFVSKVTAEKPRAVLYIDDKAINFSNWKQCMNDIERKNEL